MEKTSLSEFSEEVSRILPYLMQGVFKKNLDIMGMGKITIPQSFALDLLNLNKLMKMKDIAKNLNITLPAATGLISRLHSMNMVKRVYDEKDRRVIYISLTPKGNQMIKKVREQHIKIIENLFGKLTAQERSNYLQILRKLKRVIANENTEK